MALFFNQVFLKTMAPKALEFNKLAETMEKLNDVIAPRYVRLSLTGNFTVTLPVTGADVIVTFDQEDVDAENVHSGGTITLPADVKLFRIIYNLHINSGDRHIILGKDGQIMFNTFECGANASTEGVRGINVEYPWIPYDGTTTIGATIIVDGTVLQSYDIEDTDATWMQVEWI